MQRTEERVRAALRELATGDIDTATARELLEAASAEYVSALEALAAR
jgi:hypothetical protein